MKSGVVAGTWNNNEGLERITYGREIEYFEVYIATNTSGENERGVGVLKKFKVKQGKDVNSWYSSSRG